jgi:DNA gyrase subunit A
MKAVTGEEDVMLITTGGVLIRMAVSDISTMGRNTQGVRLIRINEDADEAVSTVAKVEKEEEKDEEELTKPLENAETLSEEEINGDDAE